MSEIGERVAALETEMKTVVYNQDTLFQKAERIATLDTQMKGVEAKQADLSDSFKSFNKWLMASAFGALGSMGLILVSIVLYKLGLLR